MASLAARSARRGARVAVAAAAAARRPRARRACARGRADRAYSQWLALPIQPGAQRITTRSELVRGRVWSFEQTQGVLNVLVNVRMTAVKLNDGRLLIWCPIAPTKECLRLVEEIGEVAYVVLPTTALEHKVFLGPFARAFPSCEVYVAPGQYSVPLNLPLSFLGLGFKGVDGVLGECELPFADEFEDPAVLSLSLGAGTFTEVAMCHRATRTLLVVDSIVQCPTDPPDVCVADPRPLLARAKANGMEEDKEPTPQVLREGWAKTALFGLFFQPISVEYKPSPAAIADIDKGFTWTDEWRSSFERIRNKVFVAPILQQVVLNKRPGAVLAWVDEVAAMRFDKVVPAHLQAPIKLSPAQFSRRFDFVRRLQAERQAASDGDGIRSKPALGLPAFKLPSLSSGLGGAIGAPVTFAEGDMKFLADLDDITVKSGFVKLEE